MEHRKVWSRLKIHLPLAGVLVLAIAARLFRLDWPGMWGDEGFSIFLARSSVPDIFIGTANDLHPPLFYLLLKVWLLPGWDIIYARLLSVFVGILTVVLAFEIGRRLFNSTVGAWAAFYLALSPMHILFSREVRMYILLVFLASLSAYLTWRWVADPFPGVRLSYVLVTLLALYTQNMALFTLLFEVAFFLGVAILGKRWKELGRWFIGQLLLFLGYLPWLFVAIYQFLSFHPSWVGRAGLSQLPELLSHLTRGPADWPEKGSWGNASLVWLAIILLAGIWWLIETRRQQAGCFIWLWFLLPGGILFGLTLWFPLYQEKQFLMLTVPLSLLLAIGTARLRRPWHIGVVLLYLLLLMPSLYNLYFWHHLPDHPVEEAWLEAASYIKAHTRDGDGLFFNPGAAEVILGLYLETPLPREGYPMRYTPQIGGYVGQSATPERVEARLGPLAERCRRIWLVECCLPTFWDPGRYIPAWLERWGQPIPLPDFPGLEIRLYEGRQISPGP